MIRPADISETGWIVFAGLVLTCATILFFWAVFFSSPAPREEHAALPTVYINNQKSK